MTDKPDDTELPGAHDGSESVASLSAKQTHRARTEMPPGYLEDKSAFVGALTGYVVGVVLWTIIASVAVQAEVAEGASRGFVDAVLPLLSGGIIAGIPGALAGLLGGVVRRVATGAAAGSVFSFCCCFSVFVPVFDVEGVSTFHIVGTMVAFSAICGACGAIAARSWVESDGARGPLQFSLGDALVLTSLFAILIGCTAYLARQ